MNNPYVGFNKFLQGENLGKRHWWKGQSNINELGHKVLNYHLMS